MIRLFGFGRAFGLPDPSPFVVKGEVLLKLAGLPYRTQSGDVRKAPKGKLPYIDDDGVIVSDTTLIRFHLETRHGIDFDKGLSPAEKGIAWAFEKMLEDNLYWIVMRERWLDKTNFEKGPRQFFEKVPAPLRPLIVAMIRRQVRVSLHGQGLGRHTAADLEQLGNRIVDSLAAFLGDKSWLMGSEPCGADATCFAFVSSGLCPLFQSTVRTRMEGHANLVAYRDRGQKQWYPGL